LSETDQIFASFSQNFSLPREADSLFDNIARPDVVGEESTNYELGIRTNRRRFNGALAFYFVDFDNRIEVAGREVAGSPGVIETVGQNIGGVAAYGFEFIGNWKPEFLNDLAYFSANLTYNNSEFKDDILDSSGNPVGIDGKDLPDAPEQMATVGFTVEPTDWIVANVSARYTGKRYADFINTQPMESYTVVDAYVDIGGEGYGVGALENVSIRLNVTNLTDEDTLSFTFGTISGTAFYRPLSPRTVQASITAEF
jgi:iron complex outermembrane receptor protein